MTFGIWQLEVKKKNQAWIKPNVLMSTAIDDCQILVVRTLAGSRHLKAPFHR